MRRCRIRAVPALLAGALALAALPAAAQDPRAAPEDSWVSVTGQVAEAGDESFTLDYGRGLLTVEMKDWDWYAGLERIRTGDRVSVYGQVADGLFSDRHLEAYSLYVHSRSSYYFSNDPTALDVIPLELAYAVVGQDGSWVTLSGTVKRIEGREFLLATGDGSVQVDTIQMGTNPLDDVGPQQVDVGDRVSVSGRIDDDIFERREVKATRIVSLHRDERRTATPTPRQEGER